MQHKIIQQKFFSVDQGQVAQKNQSQIEFINSDLQLKQMDRKCLTPHSKRKYAQISIKRRESFVQCVIQKGMALSKAAKKFNIKLSTAKLIFKKFKETGSFFPKKMKKIDQQEPMDPSSFENLQEFHMNSPKEEIGEQIQDCIEESQKQIIWSQSYAKVFNPPFYCTPYWIYQLPNYSLDFFNSY